MNCKCVYAPIAGWLGVLCATCLPAAAVPSQRLQPVDQAVADLDSLAVSLRHVEVGLRSDGGQTNLFRAVGRPGQLGQTQYYRVGQGFTARVSRPDYLVLQNVGGKPQLRLNIAPRVDGEFVELIPPNTVFEIAPIDLHPLLYPLSPNVGPSHGALLPIPAQRRIDHKVDGRINTRIDTRVDRRFKPEPLAPQPTVTPAAPRSDKAQDSPPRKPR